MKPEGQEIACSGCGSKWLLEFADVAKITALLTECPLCERMEKVG